MPDTSKDMAPGRQALSVRKQPCAAEKATERPTTKDKPAHASPFGNVIPDLSVAALLAAAQPSMGYTFAIRPYPIEGPATENQTKEQRDDVRSE
jgi:hypothetical protein